MHWDHQAGAKILKSGESFFRIHVHVTSTRGLISTNRHERDIDLLTGPNLLESPEIGAVAAVKDRPLAGRHQKTPVIPVSVVAESGTPVVTRRMDNTQASMQALLPDLHFDHRVKTQPLAQIATTPRHNDSITGLNPSERFLVQVVEVSVRHKHEINLRHILEQNTGMLQTLDESHPLCPVRVEKDRVV